MATGRLLPKYLSREEMVVATKVFMPVTPGENGGGLSRKHILAGIDASLSRLDMEYVDLYQIHRWDPRTPIEETMEALHDVVRAGKARYIGASSMFAWQFAEAQHVADLNHWTRFVSMQPHYNLIYREEEREMIPQCIHQGVGIIPWSPLARGVLAGNRSREGERRTTRSDTDGFTDYLYSQPTDFDVVERVAEVAAERERVPGPGGAGLAAGQAGRHRPHRRGHQAVPPGRRPGRRAADADRRGGGPARGALRAPSGARPLLSRPRPGNWGRRGRARPLAVGASVSAGPGGRGTVRDGHGGEPIASEGHDQPDHRRAAPGSRLPLRHHVPLRLPDVAVDAGGAGTGSASRSGGGSSASRRSTGPRARSTPGSGSGPTAGR